MKKKSNPGFFAKILYYSSSNDLFVNTLALFCALIWALVISLVLTLMTYGFYSLVE